MRSDEHMPLTFFFLISGTEVLNQAVLSKQDMRVMRSDEHMPLSFFFLISGTEVLRKQDTRVICSDDHCGKVVEGLHLTNLY
jgi:hypothetical protein